MGETVQEWLANSPKDIAPALKHLQEKFARAHWGFGQTTQVFCYARLHDAEADDPHKEHSRYLDFMQRRLGRQSGIRFNGFIREGTPSAIFKAYYDLYLESLELEILMIFKDLLDIGRAYQQLLGTSPIEWAEVQANFLIRHEGHVVRIWIRDVCDKQVYDPTEDPEELIFWRKWQAPSFIVMTPSKFRRFDPAKAWERNDPAASSEWLKKFEEDYILRLELRIEAAAGHMAVESAKNPRPQQVPEVEPIQTRGSELAAKGRKTGGRQQSRKRATQARNRKWQAEYRRLAKDHPDKSAVWYSQRIARMEIAEGCSPETIRRNMKN